ncbi:MAG: DNA repair protein RecN [Rhodobacteraceae bacterium]|nr:DNA repair protein RecN [Paracoccaceae bacterium]
MLASLSIRNILLIRRLDIEFAEGLNVLTGETGAGKSILMDALGYVLGARGFSGLADSNSGTSSVTAVFLLSEGHSAKRILQRQGIDAAEELQLRRTLSPGGRTACFVNDQRCTTDFLKTLAAALVEIHGQEAGRTQLSPAGQRELLDNYGDGAAAVSATRTVWRKLQSSRDAMRELQAGRAENEKEIEYATHALQELIGINAEEGEAEALAERRQQLNSFLRNREELEHACQSIGPSGAEGLAAQAIRTLERANAVDSDRIQEASEAIDRAMLELNEAFRLLDQIRSRFESDPHEIERVEERLHTIRWLARKYSGDADRLPELVTEFENRLRQLRGVLAGSEELERQIRSLQTEYDALAANLSGMRKSSAEKLDREVNAELPPLKLGHARFHTEIAFVSPAPEGWDSVTFTAATNPSTPAGPIHRIASGGEYSRFMLALRLCLATRNAHASMVFDEIDRGIGGATAAAVGARLKQLGKRAQLLVVTHSPQVAASGASHWRIDKQLHDGVAESRAVRIEGESRIEEIARMLAGAEITAEAQAAAIALLEGA